MIWFSWLDYRSYIEDTAIILLYKETHFLML